MNNRLVGIGLWRRKFCCTLALQSYDKFSEEQLSFSNKVLSFHIHFAKKCRKNCTPLSTWCPGAAQGTTWQNVGKSVETLTFCQNCTQGERGQKASFRSKGRGVSANTARCVCHHSTRRLPFLPASSGEKARKKVCKNGQKPPILQSVPYKTAFRIWNQGIGSFLQQTTT